MADLLQWLNLLLIPTCLGVFNIIGRINKLEANQTHHSARLARLDGIESH